MKLNPQNLQKFIDKPDPSRAAILFYGADTMRVALKRQEYLENLLGPNAEQEMRLTRLTGDEVLKNQSGIFDTIKATGFFPGQRAILVENTPDKASKIIIDCIKAWQPNDAHIVITSGTLKPSSQLRKSFENHEQTVAAPIYDNPMTEMEIKKELSRAKIQIKDPSVIDIVYGLSKDLEPGDFRNTLEKIYLYKFNDKSSLTAKDISACRPISAEANLDDMIYAVADGKTHKINAIFNRLKAQGVQPVTLCLSFQRHFKLLLRLSIYEGTQSEAISNQKPPIFGPRRNIILNQLKLWNVKNLKTALAYFVELDLGLRSISTQSPVEAIAERTLIRVAMLAKR